MILDVNRALLLPWAFIAIVCFALSAQANLPLSQLVCEATDTPAQPQKAVDTWMSKELSIEVNWTTKLRRDGILQIDKRALELMRISKDEIQQLYDEIKNDLIAAIYRQDIPPATKVDMANKVNSVKFKLPSNFFEEALEKKIDWVGKCTYAANEILATTNDENDVEPMIFVCSGTMAWGAIIGWSKFKPYLRRTLAHELGHFIAASFYYSSSKFESSYNKLLSCLGEKLSIGNFNNFMKAEYTSDFWGAAATAIYFERTNASLKDFQDFSLATFAHYKGESCLLDRKDSAYASKKIRIEELWKKNPSINFYFRFAQDGCAL